MLGARAVINKSIDDEVADASAFFPILFAVVQIRLAQHIVRSSQHIVDRTGFVSRMKQAIQVLPSTTLCVCTKTTNDRTKRRERETEKTAQKDGKVRSNKEKDIGKEIDNDVYDVDDIQVPVV